MKFDFVSYGPLQVLAEGFFFLFSMPADEARIFLVVFPVYYSTTQSD